MCGRPSPSLSEHSATETMTGGMNDDVQLTHTYSYSECYFLVEIKTTQCFNITVYLIQNGFGASNLDPIDFLLFILSAAEIEN